MDDGAMAIFLVGNERQDRRITLWSDTSIEHGSIPHVQRDVAVGQVGGLGWTPGRMRRGAYDVTDIVGHAPQTGSALAKRFRSTLEKWTLETLEPSDTAHAGARRMYWVCRRANSKTER